MQQSRRRWLTVLAVVIIASAAMVWLLRPRRQRGPSAPPSAAERQGRALAVEAARRAHAPAAAAAPTPPSGPAAPAVASHPTRVNVAQAAADEYRRRARYPRYSTPIVDGQDPILRDRQVSANAFPGPGGKEPSLVSFPDRVTFETPDPVVLYAYLSVNGVPVPASSMSGEIIDPHGVTVSRFAFNDDGRDADSQAGDSVYAAHIDPAEGPGGTLQGAYIVRVHGVTTDGEDRIGSTGFLYSDPDAQLTGRYTDALVGGNLEIRAEVDVRTAGRFHLEATLYSQSGTALVWSQNAMQLAPGTQWIPLTFFGLGLRDSRTDGPYVLRFVALSTATEMPNQKNRLVENAYVTHAYDVTSFSDQPFNDPDLLETAERIDRAAPAGLPDAE